MAIGAIAALLFDPVQGPRRRALVRDRLVSWWGQLEQFAGKAGRDLRNRARGAIAEGRAALREGSVPDEVLHERVRAAIGHVVSHPGAIEVTAREGRVALRGPVLADEAEAVVRAASRVRGVTGVERHLEPHPTPGSEPSLQGGPVVGRDRDPLNPARWSPAARLGALGALVSVGIVALRRLRGRPAAGAADRRRRGDVAARSSHQTVRDIMEDAPVCCAPDTTAAEAARLMKQHHIGDVLIRDDGRLTGIVTDRDLAVRVLAEDVPPAERTLGEICSADVAWVSPDDDVHRVVQLMKERAVRRLPVCEDDGRLVGVVSIGDIAIDRDRKSVLGRISAAPPNG